MRKLLIHGPSLFFFVVVAIAGNASANGEYAAFRNALRTYYGQRLSTYTIETARAKKSTMVGSDGYVTELASQHGVPVKNRKSEVKAVLAEMLARALSTLHDHSPDLASRMVSAVGDQGVSALHHTFVHGSVPSKRPAPQSSATAEQFSVTTLKPRDALRLIGIIQLAKKKATVADVYRDQGPSDIRTAFREQKKEIGYDVDLALAARYDEFFPPKLVAALKFADNYVRWGEAQHLPPQQNGGENYKLRWVPAVNNRYEFGIPISSTVGWVEGADVREFAAKFAHPTEKRLLAGTFAAIRANRRRAMRDSFGTDAGPILEKTTLPLSLNPSDYAACADLVDQYARNQLLIGWRRARHRSAPLPEIAKALGWRVSLQGEALLVQTLRRSFTLNRASEFGNSKTTLPLLVAVVRRLQNAFIDLASKE